MGTPGRYGGQNYSPWVSIFNMCNAGIGSGVLSFPFAFRQTGLIGGLFFTVVIWSVEVSVLLLLIRTAEKFKTKSYQELVVATFGPSMAIVTSVTILAFLVGSLISYFIITGDVFHPIFSIWFGENCFLANRRVAIVLFAMAVVLPLSLKRNIRDLRWTSTISVVVLSYLTVVVVALSISHLISGGLPEHVNYFSGGYHTFIALDVLVFAFHCHIQVMPIFAELADNPNPLFHKLLKEPLLNDEDASREEQLFRKKSRRVKRMDEIVIISMTICLVSYCLVGEFGYLLFPDVASDVLINFGHGNHFLNIARVGMALVSLACFPVCHYPCRAILDDGVRYVLRGRIPEGFSKTLHVSLTLFICTCALATSLVTSDLGTVFSILGSTGGVLVIFIIPGFILLTNKLSRVDSINHVDSEALQPREEADCGKRIKTGVRLGSGILLLFFGCLIFFVTAYVTIFGMGNLEKQFPHLQKDCLICFGIAYSIGIGSVRTTYHQSTATSLICGYFVTTLDPRKHKWHNAMSELRQHRRVVLEAAQGEAPIWLHLLDNFAKDFC